VLGLGVNVNVDFDKGQTEENGLSPSALHPPPDVSIAATSLSMALGRSVDRLPLLIAILAACEAWYDRLLVGQSPHEAWAGRLDTMGRPVTVTLPTGSLHGMATGVTAAGALLVRDAQGEMHTVWAGDVMAVR
jgi:BirA family biotin operon repressor/biotin-[acetyl-CoA-carboxylase] ligase